jgi:hypothetical protein
MALGFELFAAPRKSGSGRPCSAFCLARAPARPTPSHPACQTPTSPPSAPCTGAPTRVDQEQTARKGPTTNDQRPTSESNESEGPGPNRSEPAPGPDRPPASSWALPTSYKLQVAHSHSQRSSHCRGQACQGRPAARARPEHPPRRAKPPHRPREELVCAAL